MQSKAATVDEYIAGLPEDRRHAIQVLRKLINKNLPKGFEEGMQYGMIGYYVPHSIYPNGYHCDPKQPLPFANLASQKNHLALYGMGVYMDPKIQEWFTTEWKKSGKKLDMGKSCIRFKKLEDVPLEVVEQLIRKISVKQYIELYETSLAAPRPARKKATKKTAKKATKVATKKVAKKKVTKKGAASTKKKVVKKTTAKKAVKKTTRQATKKRATKSKRAK